MPIITISRGTFSGGKALALYLAERLGYPHLGREEAIQEATKDYGISEEKLTAAVKNPPSIWQQTAGPRLAYLKCLTASIIEHAREGNLIYHGYAGHLLLAGLPLVLRIRVIADMEFRIQAAMRERGMSRSDALDYIEKVDKDRKKWTHFLYGLDWQDPALYDMVINLEHISIENAGEVIAFRVGLSDFKPTPESRKAFEDSLLSNRIWASLAKDDRTRVASIQVSADDGVVTLKGSLGSQKTLDLILETVSKVRGVRSVVNQMGIGSDWYW